MKIRALNILKIVCDNRTMEGLTFLLFSVELRVNKLAANNLKITIYITSKLIAAGIFIIYLDCETNL